MTATMDVTKVFGAFHSEYAEHERRAQAAQLLADRLATAVHDAAEGGLDPAFMRRLFDLTMTTHNPDADGPDDDAPEWTQDRLGDDDDALPEWVATMPGEPNNLDPDGTDQDYPPDWDGYDSYEADTDAGGHDGYAELRLAA